MINWKSIGFRVTKKLVYYVLVASAAILLWNAGSSLLNARDTFENIAGAVVYVVTIGGVFTVGVRELSLLCGDNKQTKTNKTETNETDY
jgi:hypothetical protein